MTRYRIENAVVTVLGFFFGTALALLITPGDILLWVVAGIAFAIFAHAFLIRDLAGEVLWPFGRIRHLHRNGGHQPKPTASQQ
jgi:hypothetical protein